MVLWCFHLPCIGFPRGKLSFLHCRPNVYLHRLNAFFDKCIKQFLSYGSLTAQICLDVIRQYHLGNKVEEIGAFISKGLVKVSIVPINALMFLSSRDSTAGIWLWCRVWILDATPAISFACPERFAISGAMRKNLFRAVWLSVIPTSPPYTFMDRLTCSSAWSAPSAQNGMLLFLFTT